MESPLKPEGVFILFGMFSMLAVGFEWLFVAETQGLSEREKKNLYLPGMPFGRSVTEEEEYPEIGSPKMSMFSSNQSSMRSET